MGELHDEPGANGREEFAVDVLRYGIEEPRNEQLHVQPFGRRLHEGLAANTGHRAPGHECKLCIRAALDMKQIMTGLQR